MGLRGASSRLDRLVRRIRHPERDVVADGAGVLGDDADLATESPALHVTHVDTVDEHAAGVRVVEPRNEGRESRLPGARRPDERDGAPRRDVERDAFEHGAVGVVAEGDALEHDVAWPGGELGCARAIRDSSGSSRISKIRLPAAIARWAWPIHIPSIRSGMTSIASNRLNVKKAPRESEPEITIRPAASSTNACATSGRKVRSGT